MVSAPNISSESSATGLARPIAPVFRAARSFSRAAFQRVLPTRYLRLAVAVPAVLFAAGFAIFAVYVHKMPTRPMTAAEGLVVFTGGSGRVAGGLDMIALGKADRALITGVHAHTSFRHLRHLSGLPQSLFACCVDLGYAARDTRGNARETSDWVRAREIKGALIVVTSNYHMPRALLELRAALPGHKLFPVAVISREQQRSGFWSSPSVLRHVAVEYIKFVATFARTAMFSHSGSSPAAPNNLSATLPIRPQV